MESLLSIGIPAFIAILAFMVIGFIFSRLYRRTTPDEAFVRTGVGGKCVVQNGGALVIPTLHEITRVNMQTFPIDVTRTGNDDALITNDRIRADAVATFFIRVKPDADGVSAAAQTLGEKTFDVAQMSKLIEGKLIDALRAVSAKMTIDELHESRSEFIQKVESAASGELAKNGLELESSALTQLDQTPLGNLDPNNVFNAVGLEVSARRIAASRENQARIESEAAINVAESQQTEEMRQFAIQRETESKQILEAETVAKERAASQSAIAAAQENAEKQRVTAEIDKRKGIELAEQARKIAVNEASMAESQARREADVARAEAVEAEESITTTRQKAEAERKKAVAILEAEEEAETEATGIRVRAAAAKAAAEDDAAAVLAAAEAKSKAAKLDAEGVEAGLMAEAAGKKAAAEAENDLSEHVIKMRVDLARLAIIPEVTEAMVKPAEHIDSITVHNVTGLGTSGGDGSEAPAGGAVGAVAKATQDMALTLPMMKVLGDQAGLSITGGLDGVMAIPLDEWGDDSEPKVSFTAEQR